MIIRFSVQPAPIYLVGELQESALHFIRHLNQTSVNTCDLAAESRLYLVKSSVYTCDLAAESRLYLVKSSVKSLLSLFQFTKKSEYSRYRRLRRLLIFIAIR